MELWICDRSEYASLHDWSLQAGTSKGGVSPSTLRENDARGEEQSDMRLDRLLRGHLLAGVCSLLELMKLGALADGNQVSDCLAQRADALISL